MTTAEKTKGRSKKSDDSAPGGSSKAGQIGITMLIEKSSSVALLSDPVVTEAGVQLSVKGTYGYLVLQINPPLTETPQTVCK